MQYANEFVQFYLENCVFMLSDEHFFYGQFRIPNIFSFLFHMTRVNNTIRVFDMNDVHSKCSMTFIGNLEVLREIRMVVLWKLNMNMKGLGLGDFGFDP